MWLIFGVLCDEYDEVVIFDIFNGVVMVLFCFDYFVFIKMFVKVMNCLFWLVVLVCIYLFLIRSVRLELVELGNDWFL